MSGGGEEGETESGEWGVSISILTLVVHDGHMRACVESPTWTVLLSSDQLVKTCSMH